MNNQQKALQLRNLGYSVRDISNILNRSVNTVQYWVSDVKLNRQQQANIAKRTLFKKEQHYKQLRKQMFDKIKRLAISNNGKCLSTEYINSRSLLKFSCVNGHQWEATSNNVKKGTWCPYCRKTDNICEEKCRYIFEWLTGCKFPKNRLILNNRQELDGYCKEMNIAFEFNGVQHYKYVPFFHRSQKSYSNQLSRDKIKRQICESKDINLVIDKLNKCQSFARDKNWKCLSEAFFTVGSSMTWMCNLGHVWESCWSNIKKGSGCPKCHKNKLSKLFAKYDISNMLKIAQSRDGTCLSDEYINCKTHLHWQCSNGHTWYAIPEKVINGQWCRKCYIKSRST